MYNIILDKLPTEYKGYLIRPSFRIGMQICMCLEDNDFTQEEQICTALSLLYGNGIPDDINIALDGLGWFLSCGATSHKTSVETQKLFYWDFDSSRLYSSFKKTYNIDLSRDNLHWFEFISMIGSLDKDCAFNKAVEIRGFDLSSLKGKARNEMQKMKNDLTPEVEYSSEEQEQIDKFNALFDGGDVNG